MRLVNPRAWATSPVAYEDRHGNVTEVKSLKGGGVADKHTSTKSDHKGAPTIKIRDSDGKVIQTTRYEKSS
jgi:hypothetical protein